MHQHMPQCHEMPHQEAVGGRASAATANNRTVFIPCVLSIYIPSNTAPSHSMFQIKPFLAMIYFFYRLLIFKAHGKSAKEITC
jgi:uncharacterized MAPEG superfamily protein